MLNVTGKLPKKKYCRNTFIALEIWEYILQKVHSIKWPKKNDKCKNISKVLYFQVNFSVRNVSINLYPKLPVRPVVHLMYTVEYLHKLQSRKSTLPYLSILNSTWFEGFIVLRVLYQTIKCHLTLSQNHNSHISQVYQHFICNMWVFIGLSHLCK